jgi:hypothetical protein
MNDQAFKLLMQRFTQQDKEIALMRKDIQAMLKFKWQIIGGSVVISTFASLIMQVVVK